MTSRSSLSASPAALRHPGAALLRRYLRAVLGDQAAGDRLAQDLWPGVLATGGAADDAADPASILCAAHRHWRRLFKDGEAAAFAPGAVARSISPTAALERQAGLLADVFALSVREAARALDRSEGEVTRLIAAARRTADAPIECHVLVVEDDAIIAQHLARLAEEAGARSVAIAMSAASAYDAAAKRPPDMVVCDYDLGEGGRGTDVLKRLSAEHDSIGLFVTAFPDEVLSGTDGEPAFIVSKPFSEDVVRAALSYAGRAERPAILAA